jgi:hypothetical protein
VNLQVVIHIHSKKYNGLPYLGLSILKYSRLCLRQTVHNDQIWLFSSKLRNLTCETIDLIKSEVLSVNFDAYFETYVLFSSQLLEGVGVVSSQYANEQSTFSALV